MSSPTPVVAVLVPVRTADGLLGLLAVRDQSGHRLLPSVPLRVGVDWRSSASELLAGFGFELSAGRFTLFDVVSAGEDLVVFCDVVARPGVLGSCFEAAALPPVSADMVEVVTDAARFYDGPDQVAAGAFLGASEF